MTISLTPFLFHVPQQRLKADFGDKADSDVVRASKDYVMVSLSDDDEPKLPGFAPDGGYVSELFLDCLIIYVSVSLLKVLSGVG